MGSNSSPSSTTQTNKLDPYVREQTEQNIALADEIASQPYQPYTGTGIVGFNSNQQAAQNGLIGVANSNLGSQGWQTASSLAQGVAGQTPQQVTAQSGGATMSDYTNPYTEQVVNSTLSDIDRSRQLAVNAGQDASLSSGAYDGSRSALVDAATNEGYARQAASAAGELRSAGFNTSLAASQQDAANNLQAQQANQQAGLAQGSLALQGAGLIGSAGQNQYNNAINNQNLIAGVGDAQQQQAQTEADYQRQEWETEQGYAQRMLELRMQALNGSPLINAGSSTSSQSAGSRSTVSGALGGAATGAAVGSVIPGVGTAIGAGVGGTAGLLGII